MSKAIPDFILGRWRLELRDDAPDRLAPIVPPARGKGRVRARAIRIGISWHPAAPPIPGPRPDTTSELPFSSPKPAPQFWSRFSSFWRQRIGFETISGGHFRIDFYLDVGFCYNCETHRNAYI